MTVRACLLTACLGCGLAAAGAAHADVAAYDVARSEGIELRQASAVDGNPPSESRRPLAGAGDVNGDGLADVIVGSETARLRGREPRGAAYVVFGARDRGTRDLRTLGPAGFRIEAGQPRTCIPFPPGEGIFSDDAGCSPSEHKIGWAVSGAGDVNGDGLDDVILGAPPTQVGDRVAAGAAYVVFGKRSSEPVRLDALADQGFQIAGAEPRDELGLAVVGLGDVNGDGLSDVAATNAVRRGGPGAYVVFGKRDAGPVDTRSLGSGGFAISGARPAETQDVCCHEVSLVLGAAGDVNGDGLADLALGAAGESPAGRQEAGSVFVVYGRAGTEPVDVDALGAGGYRIDGARPGDWLGAELSGAGDFNGDGVPDLATGGPTRAYDPPLRGRAWVVYGKRGQAAVDLAALGDGGVTLQGRIGGEAPLAGVGDVNGDGLGDVAVGSRRYSPRCRRGLGAAFVVFGRPGSGELELDDLGRGGLRLDGAGHYDDPSGALAGAGDVNGDGLADVLAGTPSPSDIGGDGPPWTARVVFGRSPRADEIGAARPACFSADVVDRDLDAVLAQGYVTLRLLSRDARANRLTAEITDRRRSFFIGRHVRPERTGGFLVRVPLDDMARAALRGRQRATLRLEAHQLIPARRCFWPHELAPFEGCPGREVKLRFTLRRRP